jgi:hypothetical protein
MGSQITSVGMLRQCRYLAVQVQSARFRRFSEEANHCTTTTAVWCSHALSNKRIKPPAVLNRMHIRTRHASIPRNISEKLKFAIPVLSSQCDTPGARNIPPSHKYRQNVCKVLDRQSAIQHQLQIQAGHVIGRILSLPSCQFYLQLI